VVVVLFSHYSLISKNFIVVIIVVGILYINISLLTKPCRLHDHCIYKFSIVSIIEFVYCYSSCYTKTMKY